MYSIKSQDLILYRTKITSEKVLNVFEPKIELVVERRIFVNSKLSLLIYNYEKIIVYIIQSQTAETR